MKQFPRMFSLALPLSFVVRSKSSQPLNEFFFSCLESTAIDLKPLRWFVSQPTVANKEPTFEERVMLLKSLILGHGKDVSDVNNDKSNKSDVKIVYGKNENGNNGGVEGESNTNSNDNSDKNNNGNNGNNNDNNNNNNDNTSTTNENDGKTNNNNNNNSINNFNNNTSNNNIPTESISKSQNSNNNDVEIIDDEFISLVAFFSDSVAEDVIMDPHALIGE
jgi:hypothetical protein